MLIDGEKYACEACVRGHRVGNCQHADRPLTHINKKGRPVSQCPHCRGLRKARASHVKCDCGERPHTKEECTDTESRGEHLDYSNEPASDQNAPSLNTCCCSHGARCTCALKKEYLDPVPEVDLPQLSTPPNLASRKPRLTSAQSDTSLTVFTNGHHKPVHRQNDAAHKCGAPYKIPIPHSVHGNSDLKRRPHSIHGHSEIAQRSADHLPLGKTMEQAPSQLQDSISSAQQDVRLVRSEHGSPEFRAIPNINGFESPLPPLDLSYPYNDTISSPPSDEYNQYQSAVGFGPYLATQEEQPVYSAGFNMPIVDWSDLDLPLDNGALSTAYSQPPSYASFDHNYIGRPGLTTSSSDEVSEIEEYAPNSGLTSSLMKRDQNRSNSSKIAEPNAYRLSSASSILDLPQASLLSDSDLNSLDMDRFLMATTASPSDFEGSTGNPASDPENFVRHGFTVRDAQKLAHPGPPVEAMGDSSLRRPTEDLGPLWAAPSDDDDTRIDVWTG